MLEVRCFKTIDPGAPRIEWLGDRVCARRGPRNRGLIIGNDSGPRNDRLGQVLVEVTGGNHSKRVDVMFDQNVHVVRRFGAEAGVAEGDGVPRVIRANEIVRDGLSNVLRSEEHTSELQSHSDLVCRLLLEKKKNKHLNHYQIAELEVS